MYKSLILLVFFIPIVVSGQISKNNLVSFGSARVNITPQKPIHMSGYEARQTPSTGIHDELFACALCFSDSKSKVLFITSDIISFSEELGTEIKQEINLKTGIPVENIFLTAAHNHGGPVVKAYEKNVSETVEEYVRELQTKIVEIADQASEQIIPVRIGYGSGMCKMNINRRAKFADGSVWLGRNLDGPCDTEVSVLKIEDEKGELLSLFVNWPCHGTASGQENYEITGDWPGLAARYLNKKLGDDVVVAVTAGASGDINPIYGPNKNFREIDAVGTHLGAEVYRTLSEIETYPVNSISILNRTLTLPGKKGGIGRYPDEVLEKGPDRNINLSICKIGNYVFSGISGEVMTEIGMQIKELSPYQGTFVITHCNGTSGYICTDNAYPEGGYEIKVTRFWPGVEKDLTQNVVEMINSL
ncbi:neutral/alkaline non-lysosomal ceramidase N-terminal domain-containing protein [Draconibacterium sp.]|nr:neutral/alkaline non-lysosomal ceramidase N-terminal domain-containing protein [Draconibacterium sp.]